jgi:(p)ppGpp synthase/HD superfamily hydrolase
LPRAPIAGLDDTMPVRLSEEDPPIPGDRIVGIVTPDEGVTIYPIHAAALADYENEPERWLDVRWDIDPEKPVRFEAKIQVTTLNEPGSLATISTIIADHGGNIDNLSMTRKGADFHDIQIDLEVMDAKHLHRILAQLRSSSIVSDAERSGV